LKTYEPPPNNNIFINVTKVQMANTPPRSYLLFKEMQASPAMDYFNRRKLRAFSVNIFQGNFLELINTCDMVENPKNGLMLMSEEHRRTSGLEAHMEVMRLFHNFLASAKSLIDHTRVFVDEHYGKTPLVQIYQQKITIDFATDPLMKFIQDLRNYMVHCGLPSGSMSLSIKRNPETGSHTMESTVSIYKKNLLLWGKWTSVSLSYLEAADEEIKISTLSKAYEGKVRIFSEWLDDELQKHHELDIKAYKKLQEEYTAAELIEKSKQNEI